MRACEVASVVSDSMGPYRLQPARLLCPWNSPGKNIGVGFHAILQGISPTQASNPHLLCLLHWQVGSLPLAHLGSLLALIKVINVHYHRLVLLSESYNGLFL